MADKFSKAIARAREQRARTSSDSKPLLPEVAAAVNVPERGVVNRHPVSSAVLERHRLITTDIDDQRLFPYKALRTRIWRKLKEGQWRSLAITSARAGEGKTLTALNLGISLSMMEENNTVIVIDLDMRRPNLNKHFEIIPEFGIADYLRGEAELDDVLVDPGIGTLLILPGNKSVAKSSELLSSPRLAALFRDLKARFPASLILVDLPPLLSADDVLVVLPHVDASVLVVEDGKTTTDELSKAAAILQQTNFLGTVLNKVDMVDGDYY